MFSSHTQHKTFKKQIRTKKNYARCVLSFWRPPLYENTKKMSQHTDTAGCQEEDQNIPENALSAIKSLQDTPTCVSMFAKLLKARRESKQSVPLVNCEDKMSGKMSVKKMAHKLTLQKMTWRKKGYATWKQKSKPESQRADSSLKYERN